MLNTIGDGHIVASVLVDRTLRELSFVHTRESILTTKLIKGGSTLLYATRILGNINDGFLFCAVVCNGLFDLDLHCTSTRISRTTPLD